MTRESRRLPEQLGEAVGRELARLGRSEGFAAGMAELVTAWPAAVGETVARNAWPARLARDGTLVVHASSSTWAFELSQLEASVRERLGALAPPRLRFVVGPLPEPRAESETGASRLPLQPGPADRARGAAIAHGIEDPALREAVGRAAAAALARSARRGGPTAPSDKLESE